MIREEITLREEKGVKKKRGGRRRWGLGSNTFP